jgi:hypothetical protein
MTDPAEVNRISEETRAEMRATLAGSAGEDERKRFDDAVAAAKRKRTLTLRDAFKEVEL